MRYRPIDATDRHYIDKNWDKESLRALKLILTFYYSKGMIRKNREAFLKIFGNSPQNVRNKFSDIYKKDKEKSKAANQKTTFDTSDLNWRDVALVTA